MLSGIAQGHQQGKLACGKSGDKDAKVSMSLEKTQKQ
jgi:hypothetical protein